jgi:hypothetical protein
MTLTLKILYPISIAHSTERFIGKIRKFKQQRRSLIGQISERNLPLLTPNMHTKNGFIVQAVNQVDGSQFKMVAVAAILKIETRRFSKGTFRYSSPTRTLKSIDSIRQAVLLEIDGN